MGNALIIRRTIEQGGGETPQVKVLYLCGEYGEGLSIPTVTFGVGTLTDENGSLKIKSNSTTVLYVCAFPASIKRGNYTKLTIVINKAGTNPFEIGFSSNRGTSTFENNYISISGSGVNQGTIVRTVDISEFSSSDDIYCKFATTVNSAVSSLYAIYLHN